MANYIIKWTDKNLKSPLALYNGVTDDVSTSLTLYGKNTTNWGEKTEENLIHLLEHFASRGIPPKNPTTGQLWYDASGKMLKVYWNNKWNDIGYRRIDSPTVPQQGNYPGTLWYNTSTNRLHVRNNAGDWVEIVQDFTTVTTTPIPGILPTPTPAYTQVGNNVNLTLPTNPLTASGPINITQNNQVVQDLFIIATGGNSGITNDGFSNVVIRNCFIQHESGTGIDARNAKFMTIDHVVVDCTGAPTAGANSTIAAYNIHGNNCQNITIGNVEVYDGSAGVFLENCPSPHVYKINGFNMRGPQPRGEFIAMVNCKSPVIEDFYNKNDLSIAWNDSCISLHNCSSLIVRRGCLDGSNGSKGAGVQITYDNGISSGGLVESVDAINMGNGAFAAVPAQDVFFRYCRIKDNHSIGVNGRPAPESGGLVFHGLDGDLVRNPNNIATNLSIEGCTLWNLSNPNNIAWDTSKFERIEYVVADFTPRDRVYIQNMPTLGSVPTPVGVPPATPSPVLVTPTPTVTPTVTPTPITPTPVTPVPTPISIIPTPVPTVAPTPTVAIKPKAPNPSNYPELIFNEDFNAGYPGDVIFMDHYWYLNSDPVINYSVENGELLIWPESNFVDRHITTDGRFEMRYGFVEWEAKLPYGQGPWPALWLYAHPGDDRPEIDVMEAYPGGGVDSGWSTSNFKPNNFGYTLHKANANYSYHEVPYAHKISELGMSVDLSADYHVYGVRWTAQEIAFYFDGQLLGSWTNDGYFSKPMYLLMSYQFGSASGPASIDYTPIGKQNALRIRYMRAWNLSDGSTLTPLGRWLPSSSPTTVPGSTTPAPYVPTPGFVPSIGAQSFAVTNVSAPADGQTLGGLVILYVYGTALQNIELLPPTAYTPRYGQFTISSDRTMGTLYFDSSTLPDGAYQFRIVAWDVPAGQSGTEVLAMAPRTWTLQNGVVSTPTVSTPTAPAGQPTPYKQNPALYTGLTFQDEFSGNALDPNKWVDHNFYGDQFNHSNFKVENGALYMWASTDYNAGDPPSGGNCNITTDGKFTQQFGFFEVEAKLPIGRAAWPAIWLYDHPVDARPEIDIMEAYPGGPASDWWSDGVGHPINYGTTLHKANADYSYHDQIGPWTLRQNLAPSGVRLDLDFHKYGCRWDASGIQFFFDGDPIASKWSDTDGYFHRPMYFWLSFWLGGYNNGAPSEAVKGPDNSFIVNYVRIWQIK